MINLVHSTSGLMKQVPTGFSWTTFFFGPCVPLFRGDLKWFLIMLIVDLITFGFSQFVFMFTYNQTYLKSLMLQGFIAADDFSKEFLEKNGFCLKKSIKDAEISTSDQILKLAELKEKGIISEEEFLEQKKILLA
ncbi:MAG: SHOCT domain-containing protein [Alphaproteobacteria bacterium]|nr:SHOCT domain-containing protein [Alphaproteobacteria bacterium]